MINIRYKSFHIFDRDVNYQKSLKILTDTTLETIYKNYEEISKEKTYIDQMFHKKVSNDIFVFFN